MKLLFHVITLLFLSVVFVWAASSTGEHFLADGTRYVSNPPSTGLSFFWGMIWGNQARTVFELCLNSREVDKASSTSDDTK